MGMGAPTTASTTSAVATTNSNSSSCSTISSSYNSSLSSISNPTPTTQATPNTPTSSSQSPAGNQTNGNSSNGITNAANLHAAADAENLYFINRAATNNNTTSSSTALELSNVSSTPLSVCSQNTDQQPHTGRRRHRLHGRRTTSSSRSHSRSPSSYSSSHSSSSSSNTSSHSHASSPVRVGDSNLSRSTGGLPRKSRPNLQSAVTAPAQGMNCRLIHTYLCINLIRSFIVNQT